MRRVLSTFGRATIVANETFFSLPRQGEEFTLERVCFKFTKTVPELGNFYFQVRHYDGSNMEVAWASSPSGLLSGNAAQNCVVIFSLGDGGWRVNEDGVVHSFMSAPLGGSGWKISKNDRLDVVLSCPTGLSAAMSVGQIFWHCEFSEPKKGD